MLNELLLPLREYFGFLNLFEYITFRAGASAILALLISFIFGPFVVKKILDQLDRFRKRDNIKNWEDVRGLATSINEANKIVENGLNKKT